MTTRLLTAALLSACLTLPLPAGESSAEKEEPAETAEPALLGIVSVRVEPARPGPETLCQLRVEIENRGREAASRFAFAVRLGEEPLKVYDGELILQPIAAGESAVLRLHNFWSSETGRPFPRDGRLRVEVTLTEATWVRIEEKDGAEDRAPIGSVEGLPVSRRVTLQGPARSAP